MTVYVVFTGLDYEGEGMVGVYTSLEDAKRHAEAAFARWTDWTAVEQWTVNCTPAERRWTFGKHGWVEQ